tara:strand:+ start:37824 stop:39890 length:2067 start_codon:yes stop_codon:yes gene_type:complete
MKKVSAIICAYNEEKTIKDVIFSVSKSRIIDEIIVVNDGSTDNTQKIIKGLKEETGIRNIHFEENKGKGFAMAAGVEQAKFDIMLFIDADLSNIVSEHVSQLINPLLNEEADMVLGQATETLINYSINPFKSFSGERALLKEDIIPVMNKMKTSRFGVETLLNLYYQSLGKTVKYVMLENLEHPTKFSKTSSLKATKEFLYEGHEIATTVIKNYDLIGKTLKRIINKNMKIRYLTFAMFIALVGSVNLAKAQEDADKLKLSGELLTDQRFLDESPNDWAWNENRLTLNLEKSTDNAKFYSEVWLRNIGLPDINSSSDLYNKGILDPYNLEVREAYVQLYGFLTKNLDVTIGRQRIVWGTADKLNPTDNLNPLDLEDILDFGRRRGSDAINLNYYINNDFSMQGVFIPFFQPANMPVGIFANILNPTMEMPDGMVLKSVSDTLMMPKYNIGESSSAGLKFKGFAKGVNFSLSYVWGYDGLPFATKNSLIPVDTLGGININSQLSYARTHIIGADLVTSIAGFGVWAEAAAFIPGKDVIMTNDLSAFYPMSPVPVTMDSLALDKSKPYIKFVIGGDYFFSDGSYLNVQYLHGFIHERARENLNDYFFLRYEKTFLNNKLKITPIGGGFIVTDWENIQDNYALAYMPEIAYNPTVNSEITVSTTIFDGKGDNLFAQLKDYNMFMFKMKYSF